MHARRHRMSRVHNRGIISDIFGGDTLPTLSFPPIIHKPTETSSSQSQSSSTPADPASSTEASSTSASSVSSASSTSSTASSTTSETPSSTPPPTSTTVEQTAPNGSTTTIVVPASETASSTQTPSTIAPGSGTTGFLHNKVASGIVFALVGLIGLILILALITISIRAKRKSKLHQEAVSFEPTIHPDALDTYDHEKERRLTPSPRTSDDRGYYQQTNLAFQRPGYDFGGANHSHFHSEGPIQLPPASYSTELFRETQPGTGWNTGMASSARK